MTSTQHLEHALYGEHARRVPAWLYVQDGGEGVVSFIGASRVEATAHPLRYGSDRTHQFIFGEIVVRPTGFIVATDALRGAGLAGLAQGDHDVERMLAQGEMLRGRVK